MFIVAEEALVTKGKKSPATPASPAKAVKPAPSAAPSGAAPTKTVKAAALPTLETITVQVREGHSLAQAWDAHFATKEEPVGAVRQTARELMSAKKFAEVSAMIQAAIRHGQVQPWMYEALTLALQASDAPQSEIERSLMSAVDFASGDAEVMYIAQYMDRIGLHARALQLFQDLSVNNPFDPTAYVSGLAAAQAANDLPGIEWACVGILSQAWPADQRHVEQNARRVALATLNELRDSGRKDDADRFESACVAGMARDCAIKVTWTGDADIDLQVFEPSGTVC